jgi:histidine triad (HIT) family protein
VPSLLEVQAGDEPMLGRLMALVPRLAREQGLGGGFKTAINTGPDGGQEVDHLHVHVLGGARLR